MTLPNGSGHGLDTPAAEVLLTSLNDAMRSMLSRAVRVARNPDVAVLIQGETGTGKEVWAHHIHESTATRQAQPFVKVACAGAADRVLELEATLFGHPRGRDQRPGAIAQAAGGTLLLDDVGELTPALQGRLLALLGSAAGLQARLISATRLDLAKETRAGRVRPDLYHRLSAFQLVVPPLRRRREDILPLARFFLERGAARLGRPTPKLAAETAQALADHDYPGNVRELKNVIEQALIVEQGALIKPAALILEATQPAAAGLAFFSVPLGADDLPPPLAEVEKRYLERVLTFANGNRSLTMRLLKVSYPTVTRKIAEYGIKVGGDADRSEGEE